jgi:hypothetical protein
MTTGHAYPWAVFDEPRDNDLGAITGWGSRT